MLLGKRPQPPVMKRTTSMSGGMAVAVNVSHDHGDGDNGIKDPHHHRHDVRGHDHRLSVMVHQSTNNNNVFSSTELHEYDEPLLGMVVSSPKTHISTNMVNHHRTQNQTSSNPLSPHHHAIQTPHFLRTCGLCQCRLAPGRDIYMYRGDTAFCSLECREQRMKEDSRKEKWNKMISNKENHRASPPATAAATATATASTKSKAAACT